jgi:hypothetical protein
MTGDLVHIDVLPDTWRALERYAERCGYDEWVRRWIEPQWLAWLIALLQAETDRPNLFPHGKWATIQRLQFLLGAAAIAELRNRVEAA